MSKRAKKVNLPRHFVSDQTLCGKSTLTLVNHADHITSLFSVACSR
jgi:hypothetical protein